jgi:hypothetical protein
MLKLVIILAAASIGIGPLAVGNAPHPRLSGAQAIRLARAKARQEHVDFTHLLPARAKYLAKEQWWLISWDGKPPVVTVGAGYGAVVEDATGKVTLIPGR